MSYLINNQQKVNEIIFAKRNKSYGAYAIRSEYGSTLFKSLSIMAFGVLSVMMIAWYFNNRNNAPKESILPIIQDSAFITVFDLKPEEPVKHEVLPENHATASKASPENTSVTVVDTLSTETHSVLNNDAGLHTTSVATGSAESGTGTEPGGAGTATTNGGSGVESSPSELIYVDNAPEFDGGLKALYQFVSKNLKYPAIAYSEGKSGTVYVKFVVDENGKVGKLTLQNNAGYGLDEEALRVVSIIPNFKTPAKVNGKAVKVYYQLPIKFKYTN